MKRLLLFAALFSLVSLSYAQLPFDLGIKVGYATSKITTDIDDIKENAKGNIQAGIFGRLNVKKLYIQPEINYVTKGGVLAQPVPGEQDIETTVKLSSIDIPVLLGYKIVDMKVFNLRLNAGPVATIVLDKKIELDNDVAGQVFAGDNFKDAIWGIQMGGGIDVLKFTIDVRYELGLNNIYEKPDDSSPEIDMKNNFFTVSLGFKII